MKTYHVITRIEPMGQCYLPIYATGRLNPQKKSLPYIVAGCMRCVALCTGPFGSVVIGCSFGDKKTILSTICCIAM